MKIKIFAFVYFLLLFSFKKQFAQSPGDSIFSSTQIHTIYLQFNQPNWWDSLMNSHTTDEYIKAGATINGINYASVGVKFKGNSSFNNVSNKKSMKIDFNLFDSTLVWNDLKKINLNNGFKDPTFLREKVCLDFLNDQGAHAPRCTYANVYLNNQLWGLYTLVEEIDKTFLNDHFTNKNGNLFKGDPNGDLKYLGNNLNSYYPKYELKTNQTANDWNDLLNLISILNNSPSNVLESSINNILSMDAWYKVWATNILFSNLDSYQGSGHNYFIYHNTATDKFEFIAWDVNEAFGNFQQGLSLTQIKNLSPDYVPSPTGNRPLEEKMLLNTSMKANYYNTMYQMFLTGFDTSNLYPLIDSLADWIRPSVYADPNKFFTDNNFETNINFDLVNIPALKPFIQTRINAVFPVLIAAGFAPLYVTDLQTLKFSLQVFPNPASGFLQVYNSENEFSLFSIEGKHLKYFSATEQISSIDISTLSDGIYFLKNKSGAVARFVVMKE